MLARARLLRSGFIYEATIHSLKFIFKQNGQKAIPEEEGLAALWVVGRRGNCVVDKMSFQEIGMSLKG